MYSVTVLTPEGRRQQVNVTPNTTLLQILEEVCMKHGFNAKEYDLRHHNKVLDVSSMFRFTSLPNNAQLEMTEIVKQRHESPVTLGLQLESGERLTGVFVPSDSVWDVVVNLRPEEEKISNVVVIYMRQEIFGKENLSKTTLRSLGLTGGRAMLRLLHKSPEELRTQANVSTNLTRIPHPKENHKVDDLKMSKAVSNEPKIDEKRLIKKETQMNQSELPSPNSTKNEHKPLKYSKTENFTLKGNVFENLLKDEKTKRCLMETKEKNNLASTNVINEKETMRQKKETIDDRQAKGIKYERHEYDAENHEERSKIILLGSRNAVAYNLNCVKPVKFEEEPDDFFDLTINDAKMLLKEAKQLCADLENAPLMTSAQRELEKDKKILSLLHQYKRTVLRVKFPDRTVLQGTFSPVDTISEVEKFVANYLENPKLKFYLYTTPPRVILKSDERLIECGCVPSSILYFGMPSEVTVPSQFLKSEVLKKLSTPSAAALHALESRETERKPAEEKLEVEKRKYMLTQKNPEPGPSGSKEMHSSRDHKNSSQFKCPKWFKPNK